MSKAQKDLPQGWVNVKLDEVSLLRNEKVEPTKIERISYISLEHIESGTNRIISYGLSEDVTSLKSRFYTGDVLYGKLRPYLNKVCQPDFDGVCSTDILVFKPSTALDNRLLLNLLSRRATVEYANSHSKGINLPRISSNQLGGLIINLPPRDEQRRIVARIEELQSRSRRAREALESIPDLLEQLRQSILAAAFRGDLTKEWRESHPNIEPASELLKRIRAERRKCWEEAELEKLKAKGLSDGKLQEAFDNRRKQYKEPAPVDTTDLPEIPEGWCWASCGELLYSIAYGTAKKSYYENEGVGVIRIPNILPNGSISIEDLKRTVFNNTELVEYELHEGDILIIRSNGSIGIVGRTAVVSNLEAGLTYAGYLLRLIPSSIVNSHWLQLALSTPAMRVRIETMARSTSGVNNINSDEVSSLPIPLAPQVEQKHIALAVKNQLNCLQRLDAKQLNLFTLIDNLDQSILTKAFRGELVPQDPNDEPVSILLERIKQEKARAVAEPKIKDKRNRGGVFLKMSY